MYCVCGFVHLSQQGRQNVSTVGGFHLVIYLNSCLCRGADSPDGWDLSMVCVWTCLLTPKPNWRLCRDMSSFQFNSDVVSQIPNCTVKKSCQLGRDEDKLQDLTLCKALEYKKFTLWKQLHYIYSCFPVNDTVNKWCLLILWVIEHTYTLHPLPTPPKQDTATFICLFLTKSQFNK